MQKYTIPIFITLFTFSLLQSETQMADVTGDGVDDDIKIGEQSVVVINGATGDRYTVISGEEFLRGAKIDDYLKSTRTKEICVEINPAAGFGFFSEVYAFKNNRFEMVSEKLPGEIIIDPSGYLVGYIIRQWDGATAKVPRLIKEDNGFLKLVGIKREIEKNMSVAASTAKDITYEIPGNTFVMCYVFVKEKDVIVSLRDESGQVLNKQQIDPTTVFIGGGYLATNEEIMLTVDNSYSIMTPKVVYYVITQYEFTPSADEFEAMVKSNMHIVQVAVEEYSMLHDGRYPAGIADFQELLPANFTNPVDPELPAVVDGVEGKKGQVAYFCDSKTGKYKIFGFGADGKQLSLILSN
jgi:hypothetical protein